MKHDSLILLGGDLEGLRVPSVGNVEVPKQNQLAIGSGGLVRYTGQDWVMQARLSDLYEFTSHTFTDAGRTGDLGPTLDDCRIVYASTTWAKNLDLFSVPVQGVQRWVVPMTGTYSFSLRSTCTHSTYARGALVTFKIDLDAGDELHLVVSGRALYIETGGGATFVHSKAKGLLGIAGGYGGRSPSANTVVANPVIDLASAGDGRGGWNSSSGTSGTAAYMCGTGGAGWNILNTGYFGGPGTNLQAPGPLKDFLVAGRVLGGLPAVGPTVGSLIRGSFGGGGGIQTPASGQPHRSRGGGAGYTGGNGSSAFNASTTAAGGGGTCYVIPSATDRNAVYSNATSGIVTVSFLGGG